MKFSWIIVYEMAKNKGLILLTFFILYLLFDVNGDGLKVSWLNVSWLKHAKWVEGFMIIPFLLWFYISLGIFET